MKNITLHNKEFRPFIEAKVIDQAIADIAGQMNQELQNDKPLFLSILNGAFMFTSDLIKLISIPGTQISFIKIASYAGTDSTGEIKELIGLKEEIAGRTVVILEDVVDTGRSMTYLLEYLKGKNPKKIVVATLFYKPKAIVSPVPIDYYGIELDNDFVVGRGLDYDGLGRNYSDLYILNL
ncbi:MAG: phosphoribosyltransferase family protein [Odoribacter sp.]